MEHSRFVSDYYFPDLFQTIESLENGTFQICFRLLFSSFRLLFSRFVSDYYSPDLFQTIILQICFRLLFSRFVSDYYSPEIKSGSGHKTNTERKRLGTGTCCFIQLLLFSDRTRSLFHTILQITGIKPTWRGYGWGAYFFPRKVVASLLFSLLY